MESQNNNLPPTKQEDKVEVEGEGEGEEHQTAKKPMSNKRKTSLKT